MFQRICRVLILLIFISSASYTGWFSLRAETGHEPPQHANTGRAGDPGAPSLPVSDAAAQLPPATADILLTHARVLDGSGNPWRWADVAVKGDRIVFVGDAQRANIIAQQTLDLRGLYLAPGFIDLHTHTAGILSDAQQKENLSYIMQGVTTVATGNDGNSPWPIAQALESWERNGIGTNAAVFAGFGTIRRQVLGMAARAPNDEELKREQELAR